MLRNLRYIPRVMSLLWLAAKKWMVAWLILLLAQSILPVVIVLLTRTTVNGVVSLANGGWDLQQVEQLLLPVVLLVLAVGASNVLSSIVTWIRTGQSELVRDYVSGLVQAQAIRLDLSYYEQSEFYDLIHRVRDQARNQPLAMLESVGTLLRNILTLASLMALIASYGLWLVPVLIVGALPALWTVFRFSQRYNRWRLDSTTRERLAFYQDFLLTERAAAGEIRLFDLGDHHRSRYTTLRTALRTERLKLWRQKVILDIGVTVIGILVTGLVMLWMGWRVLTGTATVGDLAALYQIFSQVQDALNSTVNQVGSLYQSLLFMKDLFDFLDLEPQLVEASNVPVPAKPLEHEIRFEHVTFRYPGSERDALRDFSMTIPAGKIVAIVGANGEGKTTLMKLLCRFYDANEGCISWDGIPLNDLSISDLRRQITMLFQTPYFYPETVFNNIAFGDLASNPTLADVQTAAQASSAEEIIMRLPKQYDTMLGKWFGGEELSIGQWQRLALARALVRKASLIVLDEPTSAMDAWAEMNWLSGVREAVNGRTLIMITHRFTTAMHADVIVVLREQHIVEQGTHADLLALNGYYASCWNEQMRHSENDSDLIS